MTAAAPAIGTAPDRAGSRAAFRSLDLRVRRLLHGHDHGSHGGVTLGPGGEAEEVVRYLPGEDDVRRIDWNVTARSQEAHVWRPRADRELETWVLVDRSASMSFGTVALEKVEVALGAAAAVGLLTDAPGNRVGYAHFDGRRMHWSRTRACRVGARAVLSDRAGATHPDPRPEPVDLAAALGLLDRRRRLPGLRVVVTDFIEPNGDTRRPFDWEPALRRLAARHDVLVVEVLDPRELTLPDVGAVVLMDPESGRRREVWTSRQSLRDRYAAMVHEHRTAVAAAVRQSGAAHVVLHTDRDWVRDLARFVAADRPLPLRRSTGSTR